MTDEDLVVFCRVQYLRLVGLLGLYCDDRGVGEELAQETLARVWRKWPRVHHLDHPEEWAERVGINLANSHFRRILAERRARRRRIVVRAEVCEADAQRSVTFSADPSRSGAPFRAPVP